MKDESITFNFDVDPSKFMRAMNALDDIAAIVRIHLEIDRALIYIIEKMVPSSKHLKLHYTGHRINFLRALGLPDLRIAPVSIINSVRNEFAHKDKEIISATDALKLLHAVEALYARKIPDSFEVIYNKKDGSKQQWIFGEMNPKEQFCFLGSLALTGIATIESEYEQIAFRRLPRAVS